MTPLDNEMSRLKRENVTRPGDKKALDKVYDALPLTEKQSMKALLDVMRAQRTQRSKHMSPDSVIRDLSQESTKTPGVLALHVTSFDWFTMMVKNSGRDLDPSVRAIIVELTILGKYRAKLLSQPLIGFLRKRMEIVFEERVMTQQVIGSSGRLTSVAVWKWWDGLSVPDDVGNVDALTTSLAKADIGQNLATQCRLAKETEDRDMIARLVYHIASQPCSRASSGSKSAMSHDLLQPMKDLIHVSDIYFHLR